MKKRLPRIPALVTADTVGNDISPMATSLPSLQREQGRVAIMAREHGKTLCFGSHSSMDLTRGRTPLSASERKIERHPTEEKAGFAAGRRCILSTNASEAQGSLQR
jgi:hypothetical protein